MGRLNDKSMEKAAAKVQAAKCQREIRKLKGQLITESDPVKKAEIELELKKARYALQEANRIIRPRKRKKAQKGFLDLF